MDKSIAIVGATGAVGQDLLNVLEKRNFPIKNLRLLASERSSGKKISFKGEIHSVEVLGSDSFKDIDIALFSAGATRSLEFVPLAVKAGAIVVDNSSAFRMDPKVPLVVPEINPEDIKLHQGIIANPNCSTIIMVVALYPLYKFSKIKRIFVSTYQAVSGTGLKAIRELENQVKQYFKGEKITHEVYPYQIIFNAIPHVEQFLEDGYTTEELKMHNETQKIFHDNQINVSATCVRVPVFRSHSESINIEFENKISASKAKEILSNAQGVKLVDDLNNSKYPLAIHATGLDDVLVGRIREDKAIANGLALWVSGDQLLKGAALNAVQIAEYL